MYKNNFGIIVLFFLMISFFSCNVSDNYNLNHSSVSSKLSSSSKSSSSSSVSAVTSSAISDVYSSSGSNIFIHNDLNTNSNAYVTYTLDLGSETKDVYFVFTNISLDSNSANPTVSANNILSDTLLNKSNSTVTNLSDDNVLTLKDKPEISEFNRKAMSYVSKNNSLINKSILPSSITKTADVVGNSVSFYDENGSTVAATCRSIVSDGTKTLNIWVADDCWTGSSTTKVSYVTTDMVDALAEKFLKSGTNNDIYDWVTNIYGAEWGTTGYTDLITPDNNITIFLYDIDNDENSSIPSSLVAGFFYAKDNFVKTSSSGYVSDYSNQRIMFYIDAPYFAYTTGTTWAITQSYPMQIISTLSHEFQHMIQFYQKSVVNNLSTVSDTWINEMCSMVTEDFVADKILSDGPRGVTYNDYTSGSANNGYGRMPLYNYQNDISLIKWLSGSGKSSVLYSYSHAYSFGAYLARNYGGVNLFKKIVQNGYTDTNAVTNALSALGYSETFSTVLQKWAIAGLLSDSTSASSYYQYNTGSAITSTISSVDYNLGSINLYNYSHTPTIYTSSNWSSLSSMNYASNRLYKAGSSVTGENTYSIYLPYNVKFAVVVK
jgi:hypothetical protein